jgi:hypothetical protein
MLPYQHRVVKEKADLDSRLSRLVNFMSLPLFDGISEGERMRMKEQADLMRKLSAVLGQRIEAFKDTVILPQRINEEIPLESIGRIVSTTLHEGEDGELAEGEKFITFYGKFDCEGLALMEMAVTSLRRHLIVAERINGRRPQGFIGVRAVSVPGKM